MATPKPDLSRVRYWQGQLLTAADLREQVATDAELRRLHDRFAHQAAGIAIGLGIEHVQGDTEVLVGAGLAYDCASRPLILPEDRSVRVPPDLDQEKPLLVLVLDSSDPAGVALRWYRGGGWDARQGVALGRFSSMNGVPQQDGSFRPVIARPLARPHTFSGQTIPGETAWQPWIEGSDEVGVQVRVDTSAAGFSARPHYFAEAIVDRTEDAIQPAWFASISEPTDSGFTLRLLLRGIAVQALKLADPHQRVTKANRLSSITLEGDGELQKSDPVVRLAPVLPLASRVDAIQSDGTVSLDGPVPEPDEQGRIGVCMLPRAATVATASDREGPVTVNASVDDVSTGHVLLLMSDDPNADGLVSVIDVASALSGRLLVLDRLPANAGAGSVFGRVGGGSRVEKVDGVEVTVESAGPFTKDGLAIIHRERAASDVVTVKEITGNTLTLSRPVLQLQKDELLSIIVKDVAATVSEGRPIPHRQRITFAKTSGPPPGIERFRAGDLVAPESGPDVNEAPPWVEGISQNAILLRGEIQSLRAGDVLTAATISTRATVRNVPATREVTVDGAARFRDAWVARITADWIPEGATFVTEASGTSLKIPAGSPLSVSNGHVIGRLDFPRSVTVLIVNSGREIGVNDSEVLRPGDVVMRLPSSDADPGDEPPANVTWVEATRGTEILLASPLVPLVEDDVLVVANLGPVVLAELASGKLELTDAPLLRAGDAVGTIRTWRQNELDATPARVLESNPFTLDIWPDGLLPRDVIGLTSAVFPAVALRIEDMPELQAQDTLSMSGVDVAGRERFSGTGLVVSVDSLQERIGVLMFEPTNALGREFRPGDITATAPFLHGSALKLIRNQDLFVSWLAVEDPQPMPRTWVPPDVPACPCSPAKETKPRA